MPLSGDLYDPFSKHHRGLYYALNLDKLVLKIKKGYFNCILIYGATRSGKTKLGFMSGRYIAERVRVDFNIDNIFFDVEKLQKKAAEGKKNAVFQLDEAAFDLKGTDWQDKAQQNFIKFFDTAAKYNQTIIIIMPYMEEMKHRFIRDEHTQLVEVVYNKKTLDRGIGVMYDNTGKLIKYHLLKQKRYSAANKIRGLSFQYPDDPCDHIDMTIYDEMKDLAIQSLQKEKTKKNKERTALGLLLDYLSINRIMPMKRVAEIVRMPRTTLSDIKLEVSTKIDNSGE